MQQYKETAVTQHLFEIEQCSLHYWLAGPEDRPLIVLMHGATLDHYAFHAQMLVLAQHYRVLAWDMRGHGQSQPMGRFTLKQVTSDILALLSHLEYEKAAFVGVSMGGNIGQEIAFFHPKRLSALVAMDCSCNTLPVTLLRLAKLLPYSPFALHLCPYWLYKKLAMQACASLPEEQEYVYRINSTFSKQEMAIIHAALSTCLHYEANYHVTQPLLLMHGDQDNLGGLKDDMQHWSRRDQHSKYVVIPQARHCANQDNSAFVNQQLLNFFQDVIG